MNAEQKKRVAVAALTGTQTVTQIAIENKSSRKFVRGQKVKATDAIDAAFDPAPTPDKVLFLLPVTQQWMDQLTLSLLLYCKGSYRNITTLLNDVFDYATSPGTIAAIVSSAVKKAQQIHTMEDLSGIKVTANDELFHHNKPILSGIDTQSLYCYLLSSETHRDEVTWAIKLMECQQKGFNPERTLGDDLIFPHKFPAGHRQENPLRSPHVEFQRTNIHPSDRRTHSRANGRTA